MDQSFHQQRQQLKTDDIRAYFQPLKQVSDHQLCGICLELALGPVECPQCESLFCDECVAEWKKKKNEYYDCNSRCPKRCNGAFNTKLPHRMVKDSLNKIECLCINSDSGCKDPIPYENVFKHVNQCQYRKAQCVDNCKWAGFIRDLKDHQSTCKELQTQICQICKEKVKSSQFNAHNCIAHLKQQLQALQEKFQDYKEEATGNIKYLKARQEESNEQKKQEEIQIKNLIKENQANQEVLKKIIAQYEALFAVVEDQKKQIAVLNQKQAQQVQQAQQSPVREQPQAFISNGQLSQQSQNYKCTQGHGVQFWMKAGREAYNKLCSKCNQKTLCRYVDRACQRFYCLSCLPPEINLNQTFKLYKCVAGHEMATRTESGFTCDVCERESTIMAQPVSLCCQPCDFDICVACIRGRRYRQTGESPLKDCPVQ